MSYNASRMTMFALLSSIEEDLRNFIHSEFLVKYSVSDFLGPKLYNKATVRDQKSDITHADKDYDYNLLTCLDFQDSIDIINSYKQELSKEESTLIEKITEQCAPLTAIRNRVVHSRPLMVDDFPKIHDSSNELIKIWPHFFKELKNCIDKLQKHPEFVLDLSLPEVSDTSSISHNLPIPDFDETGFVGRHTASRELKKLLNGPYPVITIVGAGGMGKTALALKVAYDFLDDPQCSYDSIVWVSSKTTMLGTHEIIEIEKAISSSVGVFNQISQELAGTETQATQEIFEYMKEFKILLIIDNLETVLDENIRNFIRNIPIGSKILITSRLAISSGDLPFDMPPMEKNEAIKFLRQVANSRSVKMLKEMPQHKLENFVNRMQCNPGFIKWFVIAVSTGARPEKILENPDLFLRFCMENIFTHLSENAKLALKTMIAVNVMCSLSMIQYLTKIDVNELEKAILELLSANIIVMQSKEGATVYKICDIPKLYIHKFNKPDSKFHKEIQERRKEVLSSTEGYQQASKSYPYNFNNVALIDSSLRVAAKYLNDALRALKKDDTTTARDLITKVSEMEPNFYEVHRVDAMYHAAIDNITEAQQAYEKSISINPKFAPLRLWYGGFLMRYMNNHEEAINQFEKGKKIDPENFYLFDIDIIRANIYLQNFDIAKRTIYLLNQKIDLLDDRSKMIFASIKLQYYKRRAEYLIDQRDFKNGLIYAEKLLNHFFDMPTMYRDQKNIQDVLRFTPHFRRLTNVLSSEENLDLKIVELQKKFRDVGKESNKLINLNTSGIHTGTIIRLIHDKKYGFIKCTSGNEYFFHISSLADDNLYEELQENKTHVTFNLEDSHKGSVAVNICLN